MGLVLGLAGLWALALGLGPAVRAVHRRRSMGGQTKETIRW